MGREIQYVQVSPDHYAFLLVKEKVPAEFISLMNYPFTEVLDGRDAHVSTVSAARWDADRETLSSQWERHTCHSRRPAPPRQASA